LQVPHFALREPDAKRAIHKGIVASLQHFMATFLPAKKESRVLTAK